MFGTKEQLATASIIAGPPPQEAAEGSLHYDTRGRLLFVRQGGRWVRLGQLVLVEAPQGFSQKHLLLKGHPH